MGRLTSFKKVLPRSPRCSLPWPRPLFSRRELKTALQILTWRHARAACTVSWLSLGLSVYYLVTRSARTCAETCRGRSCRGVSWVRFGFASCFCVFCSSVRPAPLPHRHPAHQRHPAHPPPPRAPRHSRRERGGEGAKSGYWETRFWETSTILALLRVRERERNLARRVVTYSSFVRRPL